MKLPTGAKLGKNIDFKYFEVKITDEICKIDDKIKELESKENEMIDNIKKCYHFDRGYCREQQKMYIVSLKRIV